METRMHARFRLIRLLESRLVSSDFHLDMDISINVATPQAKNRIKAMRLWLDQFLDGGIAISSSCELNTSTIEESSNHVMLCPDEPHDYLLLLLIHSKLNAIGAGDAVINKTSMVSDTGEGFSNVFSGSVDDWLPTARDWSGSGDLKRDPWWRRDDSSMLDMTMPNDGQEWPELGIDLLQAVSEDDIDDSENRSVAKIIRPTFKPRVILPDD